MTTFNKITLLSSVANRAVLPTQEKKNCEAGHKLYSGRYLDLATLITTSFARLSLNSMNYKRSGSQFGLY